MAKMFRNLHEHKNPFSDPNFTDFFNEHYPSLCRYCLSIVGEREAAEDIVQDQFLYLWENQDRLVDIQSMKAYLFRAVKNRSINYLQRNVQKIRSLSPNEELSTDKPDFSLNPAVLLEGKEFDRIIEKAIESLPRRCRAVFSLKRFAGFTNKEIAKKLNVSVKTVEAQMSIAIKKLSEFISSYITSLILLISTVLSLF